MFKVHVPGEHCRWNGYVSNLNSCLYDYRPVLGRFFIKKIWHIFSIAVMGCLFNVAGVLAFLPPARHEAGEKPAGDFWREFADGFRYVWNRKILAVLGAVFIVTGLAVGLIHPLGIFVVTERLGLPKESLQWLMVVFGAAMLIGGVLVLSLSRKLFLRDCLLYGLFICAVSVSGIGLSTSWLLTLAFQFLNDYLCLVSKSGSTP